MATSYDQWKLASPPEYDLPDFQDEQGKIAAEKIEEIEEEAEEEIARIGPKGDCGACFGTHGRHTRGVFGGETCMNFAGSVHEVILDGMEGILYVLMDLDDGKFYEDACERESERCEPDPDRAYDSRFDD